MSERTIAVGRQRPGDDPTGDRPPPAAWSEYLAAAQQLDTVRRKAAAAAGEQAQSVQTAREELTAVRARLAPQQSRLHDLGVPLMSLLPSPPEVSAAARMMAAGPATVLAALRGARATAEAVDATLAGGRGAIGWQSLRNALVYAPLALLVPVLQVALYLSTGAGWTIAGLLCGLPTPVAAFVAGWSLIGRLFRSGPGGRVNRTPGLGALICLIPAGLTTVGVGLALLLG